MTKLCFLLLGLFVCADYALGQDTTKMALKPKPQRARNTVTLELGTLPFINLSYERIWLSKEKWFIASKISQENVGFASSTTISFGKDRLFFEVGAGLHLGWTLQKGWQEYVNYGVKEGIIYNRDALYPILGFQLRPLRKGLVVGFYSRPTRATLLNIGAGPYGSTLQEEITHSLMFLKVGAAF
ncbi:MAG: hypothetical protein ACKVTZ_11410 [Bacteroidia bacterium]